MADQITLQPALNASDHKGGVAITKIEHVASGFKAFAYQCSLEEDLDGAPQAYGTNNPRPVDQEHNRDTGFQHNIKMLETSLCNATSPHQNCAAGNHDFAWVGIFAATQTFATNHGFSIDRRPFLEARRRTLPTGGTAPLGPNEPGLYPAIQGGAAPSPGYFVSTTSAITDPEIQEWEQMRYVNAVAIPYAAWAGWWHALGVDKGDFGLAIRPTTGAFSGFVFADTGTGRVGEVSRKLFETLSPERNNEDRFLFLVFPRSGVGVSDFQKFSKDAVVQTQAKTSIRKLSNVASSDALVQFLSLGADRGKFRSILSGRGQIETDSEEGFPPYWNVLMALRDCGYSEGEASGDVVIDGRRFTSGW